MASSGKDGRKLDITLVDISGNEITKGTWDGHCKAHELFQAAYKSKPGFLCKLLDGSEEFSPQRDLASLSLNFGHLTVVWMTELVQEEKTIQNAFAAVKSDGSVITWGDPDSGGDSSDVEHRFQEGVVQVFGNPGALAAVKSDGSVITWGQPTCGGDSSLVKHRLQEGVVQIVCSDKAFAAIKADGSAIAWGVAPRRWSSSSLFREGLCSYQVRGVCHHLGRS
ncbi:unnamed protein product [Polarella glacialis]|uniref:Uncharacterized protein n=1 Tax=Polarella glacialis TaxID=89957 RepID=A0A813KPK7_POLGL|nr:unnamed protein product [Polarella glacialis]